MADIYHVLVKHGTEEYWYCRNAPCSAKYHTEDLETAGYDANPNHVVFVKESDFINRLEEKCTTGEQKISDGTDSTTQSDSLIQTLCDGDEST
jgi:hypothetical protein